MSCRSSYSTALATSAMCVVRPTCGLARCARSPMPVRLGVKTSCPAECSGRRTLRKPCAPPHAPCTRTKTATGSAPSGIAYRAGSGGGPMAGHGRAADRYVEVPQMTEAGKGAVPHHADLVKDPGRAGVGGIHDGHDPFGPFRQGPVQARLRRFRRQSLPPVRPGELVAQLDVRAALQVVEAALADDRPAGPLGHGPLAETVPGLVAELRAEPGPALLPVVCPAGDGPHHLRVGPHRVYGLEVGRGERADDQPPGGDRQTHVRMLTAARRRRARAPGRSAIADTCPMNQSCLIAWCVAPVPIPVTGTTTPAVLEGLVAWSGVATVSGLLGAYIASSKLVEVGCCRPTAKSVVTVLPENELEM